MSKYDELSRELSEMAGDEWHPSFAEIEKVLGFDLPPSAKKYYSWWANARNGGHSQAKGWMSAGWEVDPQSVDFNEETVRFIRTETGDKISTTGNLESLRKKARQFSGIQNAHELEKAAFTALIQHHAAKALIELGGSDPGAQAPTRRRPS